QIDADEAVAVQVVARAVTAVEIRRRVFDRQIDESGVFVDGDLRPHAGVAVGRPRFFFPRVVAELAGPRNRVARPAQLPAAPVPGAREPLRVVVRLDRQAFAERRTDDDDVLGNGRRRVEADFARLEIDLFALAHHGADFHVEDAVLAERLDR